MTNSTMLALVLLQFPSEAYCCLNSLKLIDLIKEENEDNSENYDWENRNNGNIISLTNNKYRGDVFIFFSFH